MTTSDLDTWVRSEIRKLGEVSDTLREILEEQTSELLPEHRWAFLPDSKGSGNWRLLCQDANAQKQARDIIHAFLGPVLGQLQNQSKQLQVEGSVTPLRSTDFIKSENTESKEVVDSIQSLLAVLKGRPAVRDLVSNSISHLLREFEFALFHKDKKLADETLRQLQDNGTLTEYDIAHIQITYDASFGHWHKIIHRPQLSNLCKQPTPRRVRDHIFTAFWEIEFSSHTNLKAEDAVKIFAESEISSLSELYSDPKLPGNYAGKCFLAMYLRETPNKRLFDQLLDSVPDRSHGENSLIHELLELGDNENIKDEVNEVPLMELAQNLEDTGDISALIQLAQENLHEIPLVTKTIRLITINGDSEFAHKLLQIIKPTETYQTLCVENPDLIKQLKDLAETECIDWRMWFKRVDSEIPWEPANEVLKNESPNWRPEDLYAKGQLDEITNHFESSLHGVNKQFVIDSLPPICQLAEQISGKKDSEKFVNTLLFALLDIDNPSKGERDAFSSLVDKLLSDLENPVSINMYQDILDLIDDLWEKSKSPALLEWAIAIIETLAFFPAPDKDRRINTLINIFQAVNQFKDHLGSEDLKMIHRVNKECQIEAILPEVGVEQRELNIWRKLEGKKLCVYTLLEGQVLTRFEEQIKDLVGSDKLTIEFNNSKKGGESLREFAKKADFLIVDTWHASHAATGSIDDAVGKAQIKPKTGGRGCQRWIKELKKTLEK